MLSGAAVVPASAANTAPTVSAVVFGGAGTVSAKGTVYARAGASLTLTVTTSADAQCVDVAGAFTAHQQSTTPTTSWTFPVTAPTTDGVQSVTVGASTINGSGKNCSGAATTTQGSYTVDGTGPTVTGTLSPAPNAAGWNNSNVDIAWSATDAGVGMAGGAATQPTPLTDSVKNNTTVDGVTKTATGAKDALGNAQPAGTGSVVVKLDKSLPTITGTQVANGDGTATVTFSCSDTLSGIASCVADGTSPATSFKRVPEGTTVTGTATDAAGNVATASVTTQLSDKTPPTITHSVSPTPNAAGWNRADATVTFSCADETAGSGLATCVADGTSPASASRTVNTETNGTAVTGTATDKAGNKATDSVTVKVDKTAPTASATRSPAANGFGWNNTDVVVSFTCADPGAQASGVKSCPAAVTRSGEGANQSASGAATDNADNTGAPASVTGINIDKTAPTLSGAPTTAPNAKGWYNGDVTIAWTAGDSLSGLAGATPANSTIGGEGTALTASASVSDKAGNPASATSAAVKIDRTAPTTGISGVSNTWVSGEVAVTLTPTDNLSGVASTSYAVDGGAPQSGTGFTLSTDGDHTVTFSSTDNAGNTETSRTVHVKVDRTAPTIGHTFDPLGYADGAWTRSNVAVHFACQDQGGSGVASCTGDATVSTEGAGQKVVGTATDGAGNSATDTALVSIDRTPPTITGSKDRAANGNGWYDDDVTVSFAASDSLSGVASKTGNKLLTEGANQAVTGTATDVAGNSADATVSGISIDKTAPTLTGSFASGWHTGNVTVAWTCGDALSGPAGQPADSTVTGEGRNLSAAATCSDRAGNPTTATVSGIQIDRTAPATDASVNGELHNGWYSAGVDISLDASDNLSGVAHTYYSIDGGAAQEYSGNVAFGAEGPHTLTWWSIDNAGNTEDRTGNSLTLKIDTTPPALAGAASTSPNGNGWYKGDVTIGWSCSDSGSGLDGGCPASSTVTGEGANLGASASVSDVAGNSTSRTVDGINIDRTAPTTTADVPDVPASGWYGAPVQVTLTGHDSLSGVDKTFYSVDGTTAKDYTGPFSFGQEGSHEITFWSVDDAGNVETAGAPVRLPIDTTAPTTTLINPISDDIGWFVTSGIPFAFSAADNASGVSATYYTIDGGTRQTYGEPFTADLSTGVHTFSYWSVDIAGNAEAKQTGTVQVDTTAPTITGTASPAANANGWNNTDVDVTFTCDDVGSGLRTGVAGCAGDTTLQNDGAAQSVTGDAVDVAGNKSSTKVEGINIDKTRPTLVGVPTDPNGAGWYNGDVTVKWVGDDALSGIDASSQPAASVVTGEGSNLSAGPVTIKDQAGNVSAPASVSGLKIDRTAPVIAGGPTTQPNTAGWYRDQVVVDFTCTDNLSGVATCPTSKLLKGDGAGQSVTSDPARDVAGNVSPTRTVGGINIDGTAPSTTSNNQCTATNGYCTGSTADVVLTATDQAGLSGVKEIHYVVDGGAEQVAAGSTKTVSVPLSGSGAGTVKYWAVDNAGNVEAASSVALKWDNIAPTVTHTLSPVPNADDWNNADVTVTFAAKDDDKGSGVASVTSPVKVSTETGGQVVTGTAKDTAGNVGTDSVTIKLDKTAPTIKGAITAGTRTASGWYSGPVTVGFTCTDGLSGVGTCPDPVVLSANGPNTAVGTATDKAGNTATATVGGINIDQERPTLTTADVNVQGGTFTLGKVPAATCTPTDSFSGVASCVVKVSGGNANGTGTFTYSATATDNVGNTTTITGSYRVIYRFDGFLQPINDTAHQVGTSTSIFKAGSTVPAKLQLMKADGTVVQATAAPVWLTPVKGSAMTAPVDESVYTASADSGTTYRYDTTAQQYIYNWKTGTGGNYWRVGVTLDDGQTYYVNIGLR